MILCRPKAPLNPRPDVPVATPLYTRFLKRYAVVELATLIGIPLALLALFLNTRQVASTEKQIRLTQLQAQPTFQIHLHSLAIQKIRYGQENATYDRISLTMNGNAENFHVMIATAFVMRSGNRWVFSPVDWWNTVGAEDVGPWVSNPRRLLQVANDSMIVGGVQLITYVIPAYDDVFGDSHQVSFRVDQVFSSNYIVNEPAPTPIPLDPFLNHSPQNCIDLFEDPGDNGAKGNPERLDITQPITVSALLKSSYTSPFSLDQCSAD